MPCARMNIMPGPGTRLSTTQATTKPRTALSSMQGIQARTALENRDIIGADRCVIQVWTSSLSTPCTIDVVRNAG
ncbi:hypothetical protein JOF56_008229 [Kibdelosporangium banguiense]|uniref:Uncharacterized protein n=1 Tax=Kibdelosporangium banguiense TaxID=1365924 RepID=A0ABS4TTW0_9PSEU|nr:hypothetical protein [Kibdelosporangium banguiense]